MHNAAFHALGLDWTYELLDVGPADVAGAVATMRAPDVAGANVTIPHKVPMMRLLDRIDADALRAHAVNTIIHQEKLLIGDNTDVAAIRSAVAGLGVDPHGAAVVVLGAGGSARAVGVALEGAHLTFVSRHPEDADLPGRVVAWSDPSWPAVVRSADLLVNATPLGRRDEMPLSPRALPTNGSVLDLVYVTGGTPLVRKAASLGLRAADGWGVLLAQGARSFELWTGRPAPLEVMRLALQA
jgi:shikimate dehydrogenase